MFSYKKLALLLAGLMLLALAACQPQVQTVEVTRVVTETVTEVVEGEPVEVQVTSVVVVTATPDPNATTEEEPEAMEPKSKDLIVCMAQEPDTLYPYGTSMLAASAVQHAIFENNVTTLSYAYQAQGLEKLPSLEDGDAAVVEVEATEGMIVLSGGTPITLTAGVMVENAAGETVEFTGEPVKMTQMVVDFTMKPRVFSDGTPVKASDSVYSFNLAKDPDSPTAKFEIERTASYEATGDLTTRWTSIPGYSSSTYFVNFWAPMPEHLWSGYSAAELLEAEESNRMPVGDGAFKVVEWRPGESIYLEKNEHYYRTEEGLPYLNSVTYKFIPDTNTLVAQLLSGECDLGTQDGMDVAQSPFLIEAQESGLLTPYFQTGTVYEHIDFGINSYGDYGDGAGRPDWFEDVRVRQAMTMCTDRQSMVDNILYGKSEVIHGYVPSVHPLYPAGELKEWPYDPEQGNAMLDEVGFKDSDADGIREYYGDAGVEGTPFKITLGTTVGNAMRQQLTQIFKENMKACGIEVELYYLPSSEWFADGPDGVLFGRRFDLGEFAWLTGVDPACNLYLSSDIPGPAEETNPFTGNPYSGWGGQNESGWSNADFDAACNTALGSLPGEEGYETGHKQAQVIFSNEVPVIPLFLRLKVAAARNNVLNFGVDPTQNSELYNIFELDLASE
jgi:peptide/nickel transport system substrate-binding protein